MLSQVEKLEEMSINKELKVLAKELKMTRDGVKYNMSVLKEMNIIISEGSTKKGNWKILKQRW